MPVSLPQRALLQGFAEDFLHQIRYGLALKQRPRLKRVFCARPSRAARRIPTALWPVVQRKLKWLDVAFVLSDLASPPGNRLEALKGNQRGRHSIRVNDQYRLTFRWGGNHAYEVCCEDYHS